MPGPILRLHEVHAYYGEIHVLKGVSLAVTEGQIVTLIGANGAGKTSTLKLISGLLAARSGEVLYHGKDIAHLTPYEIVAQGIIQVPEGRRIFGRLTVGENIRMGAYLRRDRAGVRHVEEQVLQMFPRLREHYGKLGGALSGGEQQMLAIARALMSAPKVLLLDEPSMGLAPKLVEQVFKTILDVREMGVSVLLVEQNAWKSLAIADRGYLLETGEIVAADEAKNLAANPRVVEGYLG